MSLVLPTPPFNSPPPRMFSERSDRRTITAEESVTESISASTRTELLRYLVVVGHDHDQLTIALSRTSRAKCRSRRLFQLSSHDLVKRETGAASLPQPCQPPDFLIHI
ncbi:hypothetical protein QCA50_011348 [Cerrena zonata]|uniref:Uncharacterized protein n=1 Tax=Cerrena zonata TaxID=2478898 RepID=A0AAW0G1D2_9APHY